MYTALIAFSTWKSFGVIWTGAQYGLEFITYVLIR